MHLDPAVSRLKYEREVKTLADQKATLQARGIFVLGTPAFPNVDLLYVPHHPLQVEIQPQASQVILLPPGATMIVELPSITAAAFKARFDLSDYDLRAPSVDFRSPQTDEVLAYPTMFRALEYETQRRAHVVLLNDHPLTHKPFLCLRGVREYHEHPQHSGDDWLLYRKEISLFSIVMSLWRVSTDLVHPRLTPQPSGLQVQWLAEEKA
jgi:hypothetical protein